MSGNNIFFNPLLCSFVAFVKIYSANQRFKCIAKYLGDFKRVILFVVNGNFFQSHFYTNIIQLLAVYNLAPHLC